MKLKLWFVLPSLITLTWLGININKINQTRLLHQQKVVDAQMLIAESNGNKNELSILSLKLSYSKMKETISILESVPNLLGYPYAQAQDSLTKLRPVFIQVENRLQIEEQAKTGLESAQKLNLEVAKITEQTYSEKTWQQAKDKEQEAIGLLKAIPSNTLIDTQVRNGLATSQLAYKEIVNTIRNETIALDYLQSAKKIAQEAAQKNENAVKKLNDPADSINNLLKLSSQWQFTLKLLSNVSPTTVPFAESQSLQTYYKLNLESTNNALNQLKKCVKYEYSASYLCNEEVSLDIAMPPISKETDKQEPSSESSQNSYSEDKREETVIDTSKSLTKAETQEYVRAFCKEIVEKYPSGPYYSACKEGGY